MIFARLSDSLGLAGRHLRLAPLCFGLGLLLAPTAVEASLIGDTVGCNITGGGVFTCSPSTATVVEPGVEFTFGPSGAFTINFRSNDVVITFVFPSGNFSLSSTILNFTDLTNAFVSDSLLSSSGWNGFSAADLSLNSGTFVVDLRNTSGGTGATIDIGLSTAAAAVPEPASLTLLGAALLGFGVMRRRRQMQAQR